MAFKGRSGSEALLESQSQDDTGNQVVAFGRNLHNKKHSNVVSVLFYIFALWTLIWNCVENSDGAVKVTVLTVLKTSEDILGLTGFSRC